MKKKNILKKKSEIDAVFNNKKQTGNSYFGVFMKDSERNNFRYGMSIGKKFGNAVERNKMKRQIRSIIRLNQTLINDKYEFILVIKPKANQLDYQTIEIEILKLLKKLKIMEIKYEKKK